jgi:hypothetical protein
MVDLQDRHRVRGGLADGPSLRHLRGRAPVPAQGTPRRAHRGAARPPGASAGPVFRPPGDHAVPGALRARLPGLLPLAGTAGPGDPASGPGPRPRGSVRDRSGGPGPGRLDRCGTVAPGERASEAPRVRERPGVLPHGGPSLCHRHHAPEHPPTPGGDALGPRRRSGGSPVRPRPGAGDRADPFSPSGVPPSGRIWPPRSGPGHGPAGPIVRRPRARSSEPSGR